MTKPLFLCCLFLLLTGCITSFRNHVAVQLIHQPNLSEQVFSLVEEIANQHHLVQDGVETIPGKKVAYYGRPYHYYWFELTRDGEKVALQFVHEARMSDTSQRRDAPETTFLEELRNAFSKDILEIDYHFEP